MNYVVKFILLTQLLTPYNPLAASPECTLDEFPEHYIRVYENQGLLNPCYHQLIDNLDDARAVQADLVGLMAGRYQQAGYKVGLTDRTAQEMFGIPQPLVGVLFREMLLPDGAVIALDSATSLLLELDLLARVKSAEINQAVSIEAIARHIDAIIPFIELPDALFRLDGGSAAALLLAGNVGARWGVTGTPVTVVNAQDLVEYLPAMTLHLETDTGALIRQGQGNQILGHPLNSVLFLLKELALRNEILKPGHIISLGAIGGPVKAEQGRRYTAKYSGYGEKEFSVSVTIR